MPGAGGVVWSASPEGVHANLVVLEPGRVLPEHRNDAVDVIVVVLAGSVAVTVEGRRFGLQPSHALVVPRGTTRGVTAGPDGARYLTVHARRAPLGIARGPGRA